MNCQVAYEELAALAAGDLDRARQAELRGHLSGCERCGGRLAALRAADAALAALPWEAPPPVAVLAARRAISQLTRAQPSEIMTLEEVGEFLRLTPPQMEEVVEALPAFELAGQILVRRARLIEWIAARERDYARQAAASRVARAGANRIGAGATP